MAKKTLTKTSKKTTKKGINTWFMPTREPSTLNDVKTAILLVSLTLNLIALILWLVVRLTTVYDAQLLNFFFNR